MDELFETTTMCAWTITSSEQSILFNENTLQASPSLLSSASILKKCVLSSFDDEATQWCDFKAYDTTHGMTFWGGVRDALFKEYAARSFSDATVNTTTSNIRRIISKVCPELHMKTVQYLVRASDRRMNTGIPGSLEDSPYKTLLLSIQASMAACTKQKSEKTLKTSIALVHKLCGAIGVAGSPSTSPSDIDRFAVLLTHNTDKINEFVAQLSIPQAKNITNILKMICPAQKAIVAELQCVCERMVSTSRTVTRGETRDADTLEDVVGDVDKCRFSATEMQAMADKCKTTFEQLLFYMLFTTGMRIGGFANIKVGDVATLSGNEWTIKTTGRTLEKGAKIRDFPMCDRVRTLVLEWLQDGRKYVKTPYLFPGKREGKHMCPKHAAATFKRIALAANVPEIKAHPHSARHTVCFLLAECGNSPESIAKFVGHTNPKTTEVYYIRRSMSEHLNTMQIPWIEKKLYEPVQIPACLSNSVASTSTDMCGQSSGSQAEKKQREQRSSKARKKAKVVTTLNKIAEFQQIMLEKDQ